MTIGVGESACIAPGLVSGRGDDLRPGFARALDSPLDAGLGLSGQAEQTLAAAPHSDLAVADDPAEATSWDEHEANSIVEYELQRFGHAVIRHLADGLEAEPIAVERERRLAVGDRQSDDDGCCG